MHLVWWILIYVAEALFWLWIVRWGGAERLEGTFASVFLVHFRAPGWGTKGIKVFGWICLVLSTIWFLIGLFDPESRFL